MNKIIMTSEERKWRAESDANTLAEYQLIMSDSKRKNAAVKAAKKRAEELTKRANALKLASGGKLKK